MALATAGCGLIVQNCPQVFDFEVSAAGPRGSSCCWLVRRFPLPLIFKHGFDLPGGPVGAWCATGWRCLQHWAKTQSVPGADRLGTDRKMNMCSLFCSVTSHRLRFPWLDHPCSGANSLAAVDAAKSSKRVSLVKPSGDPCGIDYFSDGPWRT